MRGPYSPPAPPPCPNNAFVQTTGGVVSAYFETLPLFGQGGGWGGSPGSSVGEPETTRQVCHSTPPPPCASTALSKHADPFDRRFPTAFLGFRLWALPCLSTGTRLTVVSLTFSIACARGRGGTFGDGAAGSVKTGGGHTPIPSHARERTSEPQCSTAPTPPTKAPPRQRWRLLQGHQPDTDEDKAFLGP